MMTLAIPTIIGLIAYLLLYILKWRHYRHFSPKASHNVKNSSYASKITIVIPTSNQAQQLEQLILRLLEQNYAGGIEIVAVCYSTTDNTLDLLKKLEYDHRNIRHTIVPASAHFIDIKKLAITIGIKAVRTEWFAVLNPNFIPDSNNWLTSLTYEIKDNCDLILGYENYISNEQSIYALLYTTHLNFIQSISHLSSVPSNTSNFIIRKSALEHTKLYDDISLQYNLGSISKLIAPLFTKNTTVHSLHPDTIGRLQISNNETYTLSQNKEAESRFLFKVDLTNFTIKTLQNLLIYIYVITIFINVAISSIYLSATFNANHLHNYNSTYSNFFLNTDACLINCISCVFQITALIYPILLFRNSLINFNVKIPIIFLLILPITLPINELFNKIITLFLRNNHRRRL